jgi:glycosyltransferase involved in cell wall biosynthesis
LKIAQISRECSATGGVGTYLLRLCRALAAADHEVAVIHADRNANLSETGVGQKFFVASFDEFGSEPICKARAARVVETLESFQPDVVHIQSNNNFWLETQIRRRFAAIKFLHVYDFCPSGTKFHHSLRRVCHHPTGPLCVPRMGYKRCLLSKRPWVIWQLYRRCVDANQNNTGYARLLVASQYVKEQAVASGYPPGQLEVLPYFVKTPEVPAAPEQVDKTILFVGRVTREKGLDYLVRALALVRVPSRLVVAGEGSDLDRVKRLAGRLGLTKRTEFLGWVTGQALSSLFASSSVVAVPSIWPEPFGIVGIEAMSYAKPVVAFQVGGIPEWLEHGVTGFTVTPYNVRELAMRLTYLLDHPQIANEMGFRGREVVMERYTPEKHVTRLIQISREVIDARSCAATPAG